MLKLIVALKHWIRVVAEGAGRRLSAPGTREKLFSGCLLVAQCIFSALSMVKNVI